MHSVKRTIAYVLGLTLALTASYISAQSAFTNSSLDLIWDEDPSRQSAQLARLNEEIRKNLNSGAEDFCFTLLSEPKGTFEFLDLNCSSDGESTEMDGYSPPTTDGFALALSDTAMDFDSRETHAIELRAHLRSDVSDRTTNSLKVNFALIDFDEPPMLLDMNFAYAPPDSHSNTVHYIEVDDSVTINIGEVFNDPEGGFVQLLEDSIELCYTGDAGNFIGDVNSCYGLAEIPVPTQILTLQTRGPQLIATADGEGMTVGGVYWANLSFGAGDSSSNRADGTDRATVTFFVKQGVNNPPMVAGNAEGFRIPVTEVKDDDSMAVPIVPNPQGAWDFTDLDATGNNSTHNDMIRYSLVGAQPLCNNKIMDAVPFGDMCIKLVLTDPVAGTGVTLSGYFLDYEDPALTSDKELNVTLRGSDGWNHADTNIYVKLEGINELYIHTNEATQKVLPQLVRVVEGQSIDIDLQDFFTDPEMDVIQFTEVSGTAGLASLNGSQLTITGTGTTESRPLFPGEIYIEATDGDIQIERTIRVEVRRSNVPPKFTPESILKVRGSIKENVPVGTAMNSLIEYEDEDSNPDEITVTLSSTAFAGVVDPLWDGASICATESPSCTRATNRIAIVANEPLNYEEMAEYEVKVGLHDRWSSSDPSKDITVLIDIVDANDSPVAIGNMPDRTVSTQATIEFPVGEFFSDEDADDRIAVSAVSSDLNVAQVRAVGFDRLSITGIAIGTAEISVTGADKQGATASHKFQVSVQANRPPEPVAAAFDAALPGNLEMLPDKVHDVPLSNLFEDPDGDSITVDVESSDSSIVLVTLTGEGDEAVAVLVARSIIGSVELTFTALDSAGSMAVETYRINVVEELSTENSPPEFDETALTSALPENSTLIINEFHEIDLGELFSDPDGDALEYTVSSSDSSTILAVLEGDSVNLLARGEGSATITLTASDPDGATTQHEFELQVRATAEPENQPPVVNSEVLAAALPEDNTLERRNYFEMGLAGLFSDPDDDEISLTLTSSARSVLRVTVTSDQTSAFLIARDVGSAELAITAEDSAGNQTTVRERIRVVSKDAGENRPPVVNTMALANALPENNTMAVPEFFEIELDAIFSDQDPGDKIESFDSATTDADVLFVVQDEDNILTAFARAPGTATLTLTATDSFGLQANVTETITVEAAAAGSLAFDRQTMDRNEPLFFDMSRGLPTDVPDDTVFSLTAAIQDTEVAHAEVDGMQLSLTALKQGQTFVKLKVTGNTGYAYNSMFFVDVVNASPRLKTTIDDQAITRIDETRIDLFSIFEDVDNDQLSFSAQAIDESLVRVSLVDATLVLKGSAVGSSPVTVTAFDPHGLSASTTFNVQVENLAPTVVDSIGFIDLEVGGEPHHILYSNLFRDRDDALSFSYHIDQTGVVSITSIDGGLQLSALRNGEALLSITATDTHNASAVTRTEVTSSDGQLQQAATATLAGFGRAILGSASATIEKRASQERIVSDLQHSSDSEAFHQVAAGFEPRLNQNGIGSAGSTDPAIASTFGRNQMSTGHANPLSRGFSFNLGQGEDTMPWSVWSASDHQRFSAADYHGAIANTYLGADKEMSDAWLVGLSVSHHQGDANYQYGSASREMGLELNQLMPYLRYQPTAKTMVWTGATVGTGELTIRLPFADNEDSNALRSHATMAGVSHELGGFSDFRFGLHGDVGMQNLTTGASESNSNELDAENHRIRVGINGEWSINLPHQMSVTPFSRINLRTDGGDVATEGIELEGGVQFAHPQFTVELRTRSFEVIGLETLSETGYALTATVNPSNDGSGFTASLSPRWGADVQSSNNLLRDLPMTLRSDAIRFNQSDDSQPFHLDAQFGYGFLFANEQFLITPFVQQTRSAMGFDRMQVGLQLKQLVRGNASVHTQLVASEADTFNDESDQSIGLSVQLRF